MEPFWIELSKQGIGFLLLVILGYAYLNKDKALTEAYQKRVDDNNRLATVIEATNAASRALEVTSENRSRVIESVGESTRAAAEAIKSQAAILDQVRASTEYNRAMLTQLATQIQQLHNNIEEVLDTDRRATKGTSRR
jgi:hypothetical protein